MKFEAHGDFSVSVHGEVFYIKFFHKWNLEGAKKFFHSYEKLVNQYKFKQFGVLSDMRKFEGGTPDAIEFFEKISDWAQTNG